MKTVEGDTLKQPQGCSNDDQCPWIEEVSSPTDMEGETYSCPLCGLRFRLYYEDMQ